MVPERGNRIVRRKSNPESKFPDGEPMEEIVEVGGILVR